MSKQHATTQKQEVDQFDGTERHIVNVSQVYYEPMNPQSKSNTGLLHATHLSEALAFESKGLVLINPLVSSRKSNCIPECTVKSNDGRFGGSDNLLHVTVKRSERF